MTHLRIRSARPGLWRAGIQHPAVQILPAGDLTPEQRALIEAEPLLSVEEIPEGEAVLAPASTTAPALPVEDVLRLLLVEPPAALLAEISAAVTAAVTSRLTHDQFRPLADEIFARHVARHVAQQGVQEGDLWASDAPSAEPAPEGAATGLSDDALRQIATAIHGRQEGDLADNDPYEGATLSEDAAATPAADQAPETDVAPASSADTKKRRTSKAR